MQFQFPLQSLLNACRQTRDQAALAVSNVQEQLDTVATNIESLTEQRSLHKKDQSIARTGIVKIISLQRYDSSDQQILQKIGELEQQHQRLSQELELATKELLAAAREVKKIENLYERQRAAFILQRQRAAQQRADDEYTSHRATISR